VLGCGTVNPLFDTALSHTCGFTWNAGAMSVHYVTTERQVQPANTNRVYTRSDITRARHHTCATSHVQKASSPPSCFTASAAFCHEKHFTKTKQTNFWVSGELKL
jgi:hypothetical protein